MPVTDLFKEEYHEVGIGKRGGREYLYRHGYLSLLDHRTFPPCLLISDPSINARLVQVPTHSQPLKPLVKSLKLICLNKKTDHIEVWSVFLSPVMPHVQKVIEAVKQTHIELEPWTNKTLIELGIIFIAGNEQFDNLISLLNIQLKQKGNRIIVLNTSSAALSRQEVMRILSFGAEYYFEYGSCDPNFACISDKIVRWRTIEVMMRSSTVRNQIVGDSRALKKLIRDTIEAAAYSDCAVLIMGERGTGKESMARLIHAIDKHRHEANIVLVDCTTIRPELSGSEFFGHEKGAYTGADHSRDGAFALADGGCLFLDEIGEMPMRMQAELLRVIQDGSYKRVGSNIWKQTDFRLVSATNRNLEEESEKGNFRKDLYDRISLWKCNMPSLNERREDIPALVNFFLRKRFSGEEMPVIDDAVIDYLKERDYCGNIRELQHLVNRISLRYVGKGPITLGDLPESDRQFYFSIKKSWHESPELINVISEALRNGHDVKYIMDMIKSLITRTALTFSDNNKAVSQLLGKSERWIQLQKAKDR